jgi:hypothetical protein
LNFLLDVTPQSVRVIEANLNLALLACRYVAKMGFPKDGCRKDWFPLSGVSRIGDLGLAEAVQIINDSRGRRAEESWCQPDRICAVDKPVNIKLHQVGSKLGK